MDCLLLPGFLLNVLSLTDLATLLPTFLLAKCVGQRKNKLMENTKEIEYQESRAINQEWLNDHCLTESDVMEDEAGEYVFLDDEEGLKKTYLPFANEADLIF